MNQEQDNLLRMLEQATAPGPGGENTLDAQTAELRQTWLALGRLLCNAEPAEGPPVHLPVPSAPHRSRLGLWMAVAAVAAAIAVAATLAVVSGRPEPAGQVAKTTQPASNGIAKPAVKPVAVPSASASELAWDDRLDEQIARVQSCVRGVEGDWSLYGRDYAAVRSGLHAIEQEIDGNKL